MNDFLAKAITLILFLFIAFCFYVMIEDAFNGDDRVETCKEAVERCASSRGMFCTTVEKFCARTQ